MNRLLIAFTLFLLPFHSESQCSILSTNGYTININIVPRSVSVSSSLLCLWSYNYNIGYDYVVTFTGPNQPSSMYTLQTLINCNGKINGGYTIPLSGGSGTLFTSTNPSIGVDSWLPWTYWTNPSCLTASVNTLNCNSLSVILEGPGIPYQVINCLPGSGLPVELVEFSANQNENDNLLEWKVESEYRNSHFTIKHSRDGYSWKELAEIKSEGNTTEARAYSWKHIKPEIGLNYYMLSQTDIDGTFKELSTKGVENIPTDDRFAIFPNPVADGQVTIRVATLKNEKLDYKLTDELGRIIGFGELTDYVGAGNRNIYQQTIELPEGNKFAYISVYRNGEIITTDKIISL